jgi:hypothetical protein
MTLTPQQAQQAVSRVLSEAPREHEAAYRVIFQAVNICIAAGMGRRETARYLGIKARRIDRHGHYFRTLRATRDLLRGAFAARTFNNTTEAVTDSIIRRAWKQ